MRLLLAEDERSLSDALVRVFTSEKYEVDAVYDGESALDYALSGIYDVILLDILMPKMKGTESILCMFLHLVYMTFATISGSRRVRRAICLAPALKLRFSKRQSLMRWSIVS